MAYPDLIVVGGGLAGCEAAWQAAEAGIRVHLYEMRPQIMTEAHLTGQLAELVCSNSLGSNLPDRASGLLKNELRLLRSMVLDCADQTAVPAGGALAVDRERFAGLVTQNIESHPKIEVIHAEIRDLPETACVIASGPLTSPALAHSLEERTGRHNLFFYDAIAPMVSAESINLMIAFRGSRDGDQEQGAYINCPFEREEYFKFVDLLVHAERIELRPFESELEQGVAAGKDVFFEGCLPIEVLAGRGADALAYGPLRPIGLVNPRTNKRPYAVVQLRQDNLAGSLYNIVGFQTNLKFSEQIRIIHGIPGLEKAAITRFGQMHRNTFLFAPEIISETMQDQGVSNRFYAGQITGVEGYAGNIATGLVAGINAARYLQGIPLAKFPVESMIGGLCYYVTHADARDFQPMKANYGLLPPLEGSRIRDKRLRSQHLSDRALSILSSFIENTNNAHSQL